MPRNVVPIECSFLIFVATSSELDEFLNAADARNIPVVRTDHHFLGRYYWLGKVGDERIIVVKSKGMGPLGYGGSTDLALRFGQATGATSIVQLGMAFGTVPYQNAQRYGDVLVSSALIPYDNRDVKPHAVPPFYRCDYFRAKPQPASASLVALFMRERKRREASQAPKSYSVHIGALLSGGARIHSRQFREELVQLVPPGNDPIIGGEMEAVGLLAAGRDPIWCVVKGIVDFGDEDRDAVFALNRPIACRNAADFLLDAILNDSRQRPEDNTDNEETR